MSTQSKSANMDETIEESGELVFNQDDEVHWKISRVQKSSAVITQISLTKTTPKKSKTTQENARSKTPPSSPTKSPDVQNYQNLQNRSFPYNSSPIFDYSTHTYNNSIQYPVSMFNGYVPQAQSCFPPFHQSYQMYYTGYLSAPSTPQAYQHRYNGRHC